MKRLFGLLFFLGLSIATWAAPRLYFNPISPMLGSAHIGIDYSISDKSSLGPELVFQEFRESSSLVEAYGIGSQWEYFIDGDVYTDSWVVALRGSLLQFRRRSTSTIGYEAALIAGRTWFWESGFNLRLGLEGERIFADFKKFQFEDKNWNLGANLTMGFYY